MMRLDSKQLMKTIQMIIDSHSQESIPTESRMKISVDFNLTDDLIIFFLD